MGGGLPDAGSGSAVDIVEEMAVPTSVLVQRLDAAALLHGALLQCLRGSLVVKRSEVAVLCRQVGAWHGVMSWRALAHLLDRAARQDIVRDVGQVQDLEKVTQECCVHNQDVGCGLRELVGLWGARQAVLIATAYIVAEVKLLQIAADGSGALSLLIAELALQSV